MFLQKDDNKHVQYSNASSTTKAAAAVSVGSGGSDIKSTGGKQQHGSGGGSSAMVCEGQCRKRTYRAMRAAPTSVLA